MTVLPAGQVLPRMLTPADPRPRSGLSWVGLNFAVLVAYSLAGLVIVLFGIGPAAISPVYPPAGIAVAATLVWGPRILPAVFVGQFLNGFPLLDHPQTTVASYVLANTGTGIGSILEALIAASLMRGLTGTWHPFDRARHVVVYLVGSCLVAGVVCGAIGTTSLWAAGFVPDHEFRITCITFFLADAAGIAVFGSLALAWYHQPKVDPEILKNSALVLVAVLAVAAIGFLSRYPVDYLFLPLLIWAGFGAGARGVALASAEVTIVTILATRYGVGSFVGKTPNESILLLEGFMAVVTFTGLMVVAVRSQQIEADAALEAHNRLLEQRVAERTAEVAEKNRLLVEKQARIDHDLKTARVLQAAILPNDFSTWPDTGIAAFMQPALEVGGDFYDAFSLGPGRIGLVVADVCGKGIAAAFFMAVTRTMLRSTAMAGATPADCIAQVNDALCRENPVDMFVTVFYAELDEATGSVRFVNAGHCQPILLDAGGTARIMEPSGDMPLGILPDSAFAESRLTLAPGEMLFLYTDGVTEAANPGAELYGDERLLERIQRSAGRLPKELMQAVIADVERFAAGALQADDMTCLAIRRKPA